MTKPEKATLLCKNNNLIVFIKLQVEKILENILANLIYTVDGGKLL